MATDQNPSDEPTTGLVVDPAATDAAPAEVTELVEAEAPEPDQPEEAPVEDEDAAEDTLEETPVDTPVDTPESAEVVEEPAVEGQTADPVEADPADDADADADAEVAPAAPAGPAGLAFGLLFQAPEPVAAPRRQARRPEPEPEDDDERPDETPASAAATVDETESQESSDETPDGDGDESGGNRRRRRRGGRGRNRSSEDASGESGDDQGGEEKSQGKGRAKGDQAKGDQAKGDKQGEDDAEDSDPGAGEGTEDEGGSGSSRRRRRRRRSGSGGDSDDPPGTTTKVREPRKDRDEVQGVKGSTRLEAKKQRRREGREAGRRRTIITEAEFLARRESVERVMVVRATDERTQIGVLEDDVLVEHYVSRETTSTMVGNVYLGRVQNVLPSMEAAFVDIGKGRNAVLYAGEVNWDAAGLSNGEPRRIENALTSGQSVLVQVTKDPIGHKGARLTSQVSLPGRYLVYVPEGSMTGISRKLPENERARLKAILKEVVPDSAGVIVRTAAEGASEEELRRDVERLTKAWDKIKSKAEAKKEKKASAGGAPTLLHAEPDMTVRVIRDIFNEDFASMVVSGGNAWSEIKGYVDDVAPDLAERLSQWTGESDVFAAHRIDEQIAKAMDRKVWLPSGGSLVIDRTEAMTVVDVNTGKFVGSGGNLEETVTKNNLEAAEEIVRQLRLRDIGGIIVIDFIDMVLESNRDLVVRRLLECLGRDRTKHQVAEVTSLGLVQMTRKRVGSGLIEVFSETCEHCNGRGILVHSEPVANDGGDQGSGNGGSSSGRSRRNRGKGGGGNGSGGGQQAKGAQQPDEPSGPTPAQIAAAAHAAAVKGIAGEATEDDVAELSVSQDAPVDVVREDDGDDTAAPEQPTVPEVRASASLEGTPTEQPEPRRRRGGRRAASSAGAPVALQAVDLTATAAPSEPLTTVAGDTPAEATAAPEPVQAEPAAAPRRKRKRVVADAGPPKGAEAEAVDETVGSEEPEG